MSTILKALRRLEKERVRGDRPLREQVTGLGGEETGEPRAPRRWPILLGATLVGVAAGIAVLLFVMPRGNGSAPPSPSVDEAAPQLAERPPQSPRVQPAAGGRLRPIPPGQSPTLNPPPRRAPPIAGDDVEVVERAAPPPRLAAEPVEQEARAAAPQPGSVRPFRPATRSPAPPQPDARPPAAPVVGERSPERAAPPVAEPAPERAAPPVVSEPEPGRGIEPTVAKPAPAPAEPTPVAAAKPAAPRPPPAEPFPALRVERTTWHPQAERRLAVVDVPGEGPRELREGDAVAGATVSRIEPSGVTFRFAGREVRRKVGGGS